MRAQSCHHRPASSAEDAAVYLVPSCTHARYDDIVDAAPPLLPSAGCAAKVFFVDEPWTLKATLDVNRECCDRLCHPVFSWMMGDYREVVTGPTLRGVPQPSWCQQLTLAERDELLDMCQGDWYAGLFRGGVHPLLYGS